MQTLRLIYSVIALSMFALAIIVQIPKLNVSPNAKISVLLAWAAYGVLPLGHWTMVMGGLENELVRVSIILHFDFIERPLKLFLIKFLL